MPATKKQKLYTITSSIKLYFATIEYFKNQQLSKSKVMLSWQVSLSGNPERYFKPMKIFLIEIAKFLPFGNGKNFCHLQM